MENFIVFKKMMIARNKQLNAEAMQVMKEMGQSQKSDELLEQRLIKEKELAE